MEERTLGLQARLEGDHWWYAARRDLVRDLLGRVPEGCLVLDAGCGPGGNRLILPASVRVLALDPSSYSLELTRRYPYRWRTRGDLTHLPLEDGSVDLVVAMDVLEHLDDDSRALEEIRRVLRPGGRLLVTVPAFPWLWGLQDEVSHHRRRYTRPELLSRIEEADLRILRATYFNTILLPVVWLGRKILDVIPHSLQSEGQIGLPGLNALMRGIFSSERFLLRGVDLPYGVSIFCLAQKGRTA